MHLYRGHTWVLHAYSTLERFKVEHKYCADLALDIFCMKKICGIFAYCMIPVSVGGPVRMLPTHVTGALAYAQHEYTAIKHTDPCVCMQLNKFSDVAKGASSKFRKDFSEELRKIQEAMAEQQRAAKK